MTTPVPREDLDQMAARLRHVAEAMVADHQAALTPQLIILCEGDAGRSQRVFLLDIPFNTPAEKRAGMRWVAKQLHAERLAPIAVGFLSDCWISSKPNVRPSDDPDRREALTVFVMAPDTGGRKGTNWRRFYRRSADERAADFVGEWEGPMEGYSQLVLELGRLHGNGHKSAGGRDRERPARFHRRAGVQGLRRFRSRAGLLVRYGRHLQERQNEADRVAAVLNAQLSLARHVEAP